MAAADPQPESGPEPQRQPKPVPDAPYRGLLVDWGGVMTSNVFGTFRAFCEQEGLSPETIGERFRHDPESRELLVGLETGALPEEEFEPKFAALLGVSAPGLIDRLFSGAKLDEAMLSAVRRARAAGVRTGLISNSWGTRRYDRELLAELFDGVVISGEVGMRKPTPEIYVLGAQRIGVPPSECVFVDDLPFNLKPAAEMGMATVHHVRAEDTVAELERLLGVTLS
jgi:epoxide hydrolase-like predicted phosphatase